LNSFPMQGTWMCSNRGQSTTPSPSFSVADRTSGRPRMFNNPFLFQESQAMLRSLIALVLFVSVAQAAFAYDPNDLIVSTGGSLPLILTVPHDGSESIGWIAPRAKGATFRDVGTRELAERVASIMETKTGKRPYLVVAKFSRKYLDANRPEAEAMESADALPAYLAYHHRIAGFVREVSNRFPGGSVLVDIHGQSDEPSTIFRGTRAGLTVKSLIARHGVAALQGEQSITGVLEARGYTVKPSTASQSLREDPRFAGGYTVFAYGSHRPEGIDAVQLEFGRTYRGKSSLPDDFADALLTFMNKYILKSK
jgi:N-formylglutamate amidohydrolase